MGLLLTALLLGTWPELPVPEGQSLNLDTSSEVTFGEVRVVDAGKPLVVRGHRWSAYAQNSASDADLWAKWKPLLVAQGWKSTSDDGGHSLKRVEGKVEWRLWISAPNYDSPQVRLVEVGGAAMKLTLTPPGERADAIEPEADFPFAPAFPGQERTGGGRAESPFIVNLPGESRFLAEAKEVRWYRAPKSLSRLEAVVAAADGLKRAGWEVPVVDEEDGVVQAHFSKRGRDLWLEVSHKEDGTDQALSMAVVDLGGEDLGQALDRDCKATLRGVTFEFNKASLTRESEATLGRVAKALVARGTLKLEVAGHTDALGGDESNQKLSEARAASVVKWLSGHGVAAARLTARGYGKTAPVADNDSAEGRAKNRRVELTCAK